MLLGKKPARAVCFLILVAVTLVCGGCIEERTSEITSNPLISDAISEWTTEAEARWPPSGVLKSLREVYKLHRDNKPAAAVSALKEIGGTLRFAPDSVLALGSEERGKYYVSGRLHPSVSMLRSVHTHNVEYAMSLYNQGKRSDALVILALNLSMSHQLAESEPHDTTSLLAALVIWKDTWDQVSETLTKEKRADAAAKAAMHSELAADFLHKTVSPLLKRKWVEEEELLAKLKDGVAEEEVESELTKLDMKFLPEVTAVIRLWLAKTESPERLLADVVDGSIK